MGSYPYNQRQAKKNRSGWLIGCGGALIIGICLMAFLLLGGFAGLIALFGGEPEGLSVQVSVPTSQVQVGDSFEIRVALSNVGTQNINITEIQLPNDLLANALVTGIEPSGTQGLDYGDKTAFQFNLLIAPQGVETVLFHFEALNSGDISGDIGVPVGTRTSTSKMRVVISPRALVEEPPVEAPPMMGDVIPYQSVVQILAMIDIGDQWVDAWSGSGTIISEDGLILTNDHVVYEPFFPEIRLAVAITTQQDQPPVPMFYAEVLQADYYLDLAVIKITTDLAGNPVDFANLGLQPVPIGNSDDLQLGDPLVIIGYPGIGGQTITLTRGEVSGFTAEAPYGNRAFIKTSATIAGGNSGGLAATQQGEIVGVPTQLGSGDLEAGFVDCRFLVDTNRDGIIDENDHCIPLGGFINAVRPITLAIPMVEAAKAGEVAFNRPSAGAYETHEFSGDVIFEESFADNRHNWNLFDDSNGSADIANGQLLIDVDRSNYLIFSRKEGIYENPLMVAEAQFNRPTSDGELGLICGYQDIDNFTIFLISEDGFYVIYKFENDEVVYLVDWTYSDFVAESTTYELAVYCGPDGLAFGLNGVLLAEAFDPNYIPGEVGLIASCYENAGLTVGFDSFKIYRP